MRKGGATKQRRQSFSKRKLAKKPVRNSARRKRTRQSCKKSNRLRYGGVLYEGGETEAMNLIFKLIMSLPPMKFVGKGNAGITFELDVDLDNRPTDLKTEFPQQFFGLNDEGTAFDKPIKKILIKVIPSGGVSGAKIEESKIEEFDKEVFYTNLIYKATAKNGHPFTPSLIAYKTLSLKESETIRNKINKPHYMYPIKIIALEYFENYQTVESYLEGLANNLKETLNTTPKVKNDQIEELERQIQEKRAEFWKEIEKKHTFEEEDQISIEFVKNRNIIMQQIESLISQQDPPEMIEELKQMIEELKQVFGRIAAYLIIMADFTKLVHDDANLGNIMIHKNDNTKIKIIDLDNMSTLQGFLKKDTATLRHSFDLSDFLKNPDHYYRKQDTLTREDGRYKSDKFKTNNVDIIFGVILSNFLSYLIQLESTSGPGIYGKFKDKDLAQQIISNTVAKKELFINQSVIPIIEEYLAFQSHENVIKALENYNTNIVLKGTLDEPI
jgi:hypothetical protein